MKLFGCEALAFHRLLRVVQGALSTTMSVDTEMKRRNVMLFLFE